MSQTNGILLDICLKIPTIKEFVNANLGLFTDSQHVKEREALINGYVQIAAIETGSQRHYAGIASSLILAKIQGRRR